MWRMVGLMTLVMVPGLSGQQVGFDEGWDLQGDGVRAEFFQGRPTLAIPNGFAYRRDVRFENGTLEFDLQVTRERSFVYLYFRMQSDGESEEFYLRPHKSGLPDAVQYSPIFQGASSWQLYHGPGGTAAAPLPAGEWIHVRLVVKDRQAALFIGDMSQPALLVPRLARDSQPGYLALRSFVPGGGSPGSVAARFANLVLRPGAYSYVFPTPEVAAAPPGIIERWAISQPFAPDTGTVRVVSESTPGGQYTVAGTDSKGLLEFRRHLRIPQGMRRVGSVARVTVRADRPGIRRLNLGYSDEISVFFNGRLIYSGDASYSFDAPRRDGVIGLDQAALYLPMEEGENTLVVTVADSFGGWGLMGQFEDPSGLTIIPR